MFFIRKLEKPAAIIRIKASSSVENIDSDVLHAEFGSKDNSLSFWTAQEITEIEEVAFAIALSVSKVDKLRFVVFNDESFDKTEIVTRKTVGKTGYRKYQNNHIDFINLNYERIGKLLGLYKSTKDPFESGEYELSKDRIEQKIRSLNTDELDFQGMNDDLLIKVKSIRKEK